MSRLLPFTKMHGLGNDFVVVSDSEEGGPFTLTEREAQKICDRRLGIGADQILHLRRPQRTLPEGGQADARMEIWNADGSTAGMCGNGIRAIGIFLHRYGAEAGKKAEVPALKGKVKYALETVNGFQGITLKGDRVRVAMGRPKLQAGFSGDCRGEIVEAAGQEFHFYEVDVGNPHAVIFVNNASSVPLADWGQALEHHRRFPQRTNVEFVQVDREDRITIRVWERGAGATLACGSGACASAAAALALKRARSPLEVVLPGGSLQIEWDGRGELFMEGPAQEVFRGVIAL